MDYVRLGGSAPPRSLTNPVPVECAGKAIGWMAADQAACPRNMMRGALGWWHLSSIDTHHSIENWPAGTPGTGAAETEPTIAGCLRVGGAGHGVWDWDPAELGMYASPVVDRRTDLGSATRVSCLAGSLLARAPLPQPRHVGAC
jgi:hypothetical protein